QSHLHLHSCPTRRSSDLVPAAPLLWSAATQTSMSAAEHRGAVAAARGRDDIAAAGVMSAAASAAAAARGAAATASHRAAWTGLIDRKSTRLNSSHQIISY